jgi:oxygen-independent coproporphyrinogen III oxidase
MNTRDSRDTLIEAKFKGRKASFKANEGDIIPRSQQIIADYDLEGLRTHKLHQDLNAYCYTATYPPLKIADEFRIGKSRHPFAPSLPENVHLYFHIPLCTGRCSFCHFNVVSPAHSQHIADYLDLLKTEIQNLKQYAHNSKATSVYFGGGTPSLLSAKDLNAILDQARQLITIPDGTTITLEVHPEVVNNNPKTYLEELKAIGISRISIGVQDFNPVVLAGLGRRHSPEQAEELLKLAVDLGLKVNLDLMTPLPYQTPQTWLATLWQAFSLNTDTVTLYTTSLRDSMKMSADIRAGAPFPWNDVYLLYTMAQQAGLEFGYGESVSRWFSKKVEKTPSLAHLKERTPVLGLGAGAYGYVNGVQYYNYPTLSEYRNRITAKEPVVWRTTELNGIEKAHRDLVFSAREGNISFQKFKIYYDIDIAEIFQEKIGLLQSLELAFIEKQNLILTAKGRMLSDEIARSFMSPAVHQRLLDIAKSDASLRKLDEHLNHFYEVV